MRRAKPLRLADVERSVRHAGTPRITGRPGGVNAVPVRTSRAPMVNFDSAPTLHGTTVMRPAIASAGPYPYTSYEATSDYTQYPYSAFGKIFMVFEGELFVCSGTSIASDNKSMVWTAGHCVYNTSKGYVEDLIFVPAYKDGDAPFGVFPIYDAIIPQGWTEHGNWADDQAAVVVGPNEDGVFLNDAVGSLGIEWNEEPIDFTAIGYPGDPEPKYNGERMIACDSDIGGYTDEYYGGYSLAIGCDMEFGASGGGWIAESGLINSNVSHGEPGSEVMFGPFFDDITNQVYDLANDIGAPSDSPDSDVTPQPVEPPTLHEMALKLRVSKHLVAAGRMSAADGYVPCTAGAPIGVFRRTQAGWKLLKVTNTNELGKYRFKLPDKPGMYAVYSPEGTVDSQNSCAEVASLVRRHRH